MKLLKLKRPTKNDTVILAWHSVSVDMYQAFFPKAKNVQWVSTYEVEDTNQDKLEELSLEYFDYLQTFPMNVITKSSMLMGADPELFLLDKDSKLIPAYTKLNDQDKNNTQNLSVYNDGFQMEFSFPPKACHAYLVDSLREGLQLAIDTTKADKISLNTTVELTQEQLNAAPEKYAQFGCVPSFNVYGMSGHIVDGRSTLVRSSGGHIHFSLSEHQKNPEFIKAAVRDLDRIVGILGVAMFGKYDDPRRRQSYGLAGEYRTPKHGLEYRTLSSAWLCHPYIAQLILGMARACVAHASSGVVDSLFTETDDKVIECINSNNQEMARKIINDNIKLFQMYVVGGFALHYTVETPKIDKLMSLISQDVAAWIKDPADIMGNWHINGKWQLHANGDQYFLSNYVRVL